MHPPPNLSKNKYQKILLVSGKYLPLYYVLPYRLVAVVFLWATTTAARRWQENEKQAAG